MIASTFHVACDKNGEGEDMVFNVKAGEHIIAFWDGTIRIKTGPCTVHVPLGPLDTSSECPLAWEEGELIFHAELCYDLSDVKFFQHRKGSKGSAVVVFKGVLIPQDQR